MRARVQPSWRRYVANPRARPNTQDVGIVESPPRAPDYFPRRSVDTDIHAFLAHLAHTLLLNLEKGAHGQAAFTKLDPAIPLLTVSCEVFKFPSRRSDLLRRRSLLTLKAALETWPELCNAMGPLATKSAVLQQPHDELHASAISVRS